MGSVGSGIYADIAKLDGNQMTGRSVRPWNGKDESPVNKTILLVAALAVVGTACGAANATDQPRDVIDVTMTIADDAVALESTTTTSEAPATTTTEAPVTTITFPPYPWGWSEAEFNDRTPTTPTFLYLDGAGIPHGMSQGEYERRTSSGEIFRSLLSAPDWYLDAWTFRDAFAEYYAEITNGVEAELADVQGVEVMDLSRPMVADYITARADGAECGDLAEIRAEAQAETPEFAAFHEFSLAWHRDVLQELEQQDAACGFEWPDIGDVDTSG